MVSGVLFIGFLFLLEPIITTSDFSLIESSFAGVSCCPSTLLISNCVGQLAVFVCEIIEIWT